MPSLNVDKRTVFVFNHYFPIKSSSNTKIFNGRISIKELVRRHSPTSFILLCVNTDTKLSKQWESFFFKRKVGRKFCK